MGLQHLISLSAVLLFPSTVLLAQSSSTIPLQLPTDNKAIFEGGGPDFYMHVIRNYQGRTTTPWEGGQYGFVRNPQETSAGRIYTRFHEGLDIRPLRRDAQGEPLDEIYAVSPGRVVYVSRDESQSGYGRYVVVEHVWDGSPYYSLYAHLSEIRVSEGQSLRMGETLAIMGHTGRGLDRARSHLHFEINLLLNSNYQVWHESHHNTPNHHGLYNGINLTGFDPAGFFLAYRNNPQVSVAEFFATQEPFFWVRFPGTADIEILRRYPWLVQGSSGSPVSWDIAFDRSGLPLRAEASSSRVSVPTAVRIASTKAPLSAMTRSLVGGTVSNPQLTERGLATMRLLIGQAAGE
ncbi:MAG: M23 family metallopeptidase [Verrucomicrobiales bacterium]